jgi:tripartite-type tricarboxylate transporter receptor subunit TctC
MWVKYFSPRKAGSGARRHAPVANAFEEVGVGSNMAAGFSTWLAMCLLFVLSQADESLANDHPAAGKTVTILVPYPPGGSGDILGRAIGEILSRQLSGTFIIQNVPGGSQTIASQRLARSTPDGYTLMIGTVTNLAINPTMKTKLGYDPLKDFEPVSLVMVAPQYLVTSPKFPANNVEELIVESKKVPGKFTFGSPGHGTSPHIAAALMAHRAGIEMRHVPYTGAAPAFRDVMAGHIDMTFITSVMSSVKAGQVKALAVASSKRMPVAPGIPTFGESGLPGFEQSVWMGVIAPAGTPPAIVRTISEEIANATKSGALRERLGAYGEEVDLPASKPEEFRAYIERQIAMWRETVNLLGLAP